MRSAALFALSFLASAASAQNAAAPQTEETVPTSREEVEVGEAYRQGVYTDWTVRCIKRDQAEDICEMRQPLNDDGGSRTAEISVFPVGEGQLTAAGTIVTPLETLLTQGVSLAVDGAEARRYPFTFCNRVGCVAQVGFTQEAVDALKRGATATLSIVPLVAPDQVVSLDVSLSGFTAAFDSLPARAPEN